jgi:hypothetical protein
MRIGLEINGVVQAIDGAAMGALLLSVPTHVAESLPSLGGLTVQ